MGSPVNQQIAGESELRLESHTQCTLLYLGMYWNACNNTHCSKNFWYLTGGCFRGLETASLQEAWELRPAILIAMGHSHFTFDFNLWPGSYFIYLHFLEPHTYLARQSTKILLELSKSKLCLAQPGWFPLPVWTISVTALKRHAAP